MSSVKSPQGSSLSVNNSISPSEFEIFSPNTFPTPKPVLTIFQHRESKSGSNTPIRYENESKSITIRTSPRPSFSFNESSKNSNSPLNTPPIIDHRNITVKFTLEEDTKTNDNSPTTPTIPAQRDNNTLQIFLQNQFLLFNKKQAEEKKFQPGMKIISSHRYSLPLPTGNNNIITNNDTNHSYSIKPTAENSNSYNGLDSVLTSEFKQNYSSSYITKQASVLYPESWIPPVFNNINHSSTSESVIADWLTSLNLIHTEKQRKKMLDLQPVSFARFILPIAPPAQVLLAAKFFALFVLADDDLIETAFHLNIQPHCLQSFHKIWIAVYKDKHNTNTSDNNKDTYINQVQQQILELDNTSIKPTILKYFHGWYELANSYVNLGANLGWCNRMSEFIQEWIMFGIREAILANQLSHLTLNEHEIELNRTKFDTSNEMDLLSYLVRQRIITIACPFWILLTELATGISVQQITNQFNNPNYTNNELTTEFMREYRNLIDIASIPTFLVNELLGLSRDVYLQVLDPIQNGDIAWTNIALVYHILFNNQGGILDNTINFVIHLHDACLKEFQTLKSKLIEFVTKNITNSNNNLSHSLTQLNRLFSSICWVTRGYGQWHEHAPRYKQHIILDKGHNQAFKFQVKDQR